jgi:hypothetical protein
MDDAGNYPPPSPLQRVRNQASAYAEAAGLVGEVDNRRVLLTLLPSAARGFLARRGKQGVPSLMHSEHQVYFDWNYASDMPSMRDLYRRAKQNQWDADVALDWATDVDPENPERALLPYEFFATERLREHGIKMPRGSREDLQLRYDMTSWMLSQFLHGEQGALHAAAQVTESVRWMDGKLYGATQVMDEARHVEVFAKYLDEKLSGHYAVNAHLRMLLDDIIADSRWDMTYLGMQIMVEGLALAAFGFMHSMTGDPLLKQLLRYVMADEARHVAFGVLSLQEYYQELNAAELRERQEFAFEAAVRMRDRFLQQEVWDRMGIDTKTIVPIVAQAPERAAFQALLFSKIVPNCKKLGLLDAADGWLRTKFTELGVIEFESWVDTTEEYDAMASVPPQDRVAS